MYDFLQRVSTKHKYLNAMKDDNDIKLENYEDEDIGDIVVILEKSFAIKFDQYAFINVRTFGELCDVVESYIQYDHKEGCTKQQAFYKIRAAISETQSIDKSAITLGSKLADLFPRHNRRRQIKIFKKQLGIKVKFLTFPGWLATTLFAGLLCSFIAFFFDWKVALSGTAFFALTITIAEKLGKDLELDTVKDLTEKAVTEYYVEIRRSKLTVNRKEIVAIITDAFSRELSLEKEHLTRDAKFSWA